MGKKIKFNYEGSYENLKYLVKQTATISFYQDKGDIWRFDEVKYTTSQKVYNEKDWQFLGEIALEIQKIKKQLNGDTE